MSNRLDPALGPIRLSLVLRLLLGGTLLYASLHKIAAPPDFAKIIFNYKLFPPQAINLLAIYMPWVEAVAGVALIAGIGRRGGALLAGLLFATFIGMLTYNLWRECPTICGCFDTYASGESLTDADKFAKMRTEILLDVGLLIVAAQVFLASFIPRGGEEPSTVA